MHHLVGMAEIAEIIGVSRQRVSQLIETYEDFPKPEVELSGGRVWSRTAIETWIASHPERAPGRPEADEEPKRARFFEKRSSDATSFSFERFTDRARRSIVHAQEEARLLQHNYIGTEHLLLGLIAIREGLAFQVLDAHNIALEAVRAAVERMIGRGTQAPVGHIPFTPRSKKVLELTLREALQLSHNYIGTEHILLSLVRETAGVAWKVLEELGLERVLFRQEILDAVAGAVPVKQAAMKDAMQQCSFCGKKREDVGRLVAGPGVTICDECVRLAEDIVEGEAELEGGRALLGRDLETLKQKLAALERRLDAIDRGDES